LSVRGYFAARGARLSGSKLSTATAAESFLVGAVTDLSAFRKHTFHFIMRPRYDMHAYQFADSSRRRRAGIGRRFNRTDITAYKDGHVTRANIFFADKLNVCGFDHRIGAFNRTDKSFGLYHTERF
jgi:hypothetical protein